MKACLPLSRNARPPDCRATRLVRQRGVTLLELLVTILIFGVVAAIALPNMASFMQSNQITSQANSLVGALNLARGEAITRGVNVTVCSSNNQTTCGGAWADGWIVVLDTAVAGASPPNAPIESTVLQVYSPLEGGATLTGGPTFIRYTARGLADLSADPDPYQLRTPGCTGSQGRDIDVSITGQITTTDGPCP